MLLFARLGKNYQYWCIFDALLVLKSPSEGPTSGPFLLLGKDTSFCFLTQKIS